MVTAFRFRCMNRFTLATLLAAAAVAAAAAAGESAHEFWPRFPPPARLVLMEPTSGTGEGMLAQSLAGLVARSERRGERRELIWLANTHPAYQLWFRMLVADRHPRTDGPSSIWTLLDRYHKAGLVKGYILYRADNSKRELHEEGPLDPSVNVASSVCGHLGGVLISQDLEPRAKAAGLPRLLDARGWTEERCFAEYGKYLDRTVVAMQDPKVSNIRAEAIAMDAIVLTQPGPLLDRVLAWAKPEGPILGWGVGDERKQTEVPTRWGRFETATDWCLNLPPLAATRPQTEADWNGLRPAHTSSLWDARWEDGVHYAAMVMSDGDNIQWYMGDFTEDSARAWWSSPDRGSVPIGWTSCYDGLAQLCPYTLRHLFKTATPRDDFVLMSGGYYYPDLFGEKRPGADLLAQHARRMGEYMRRGGTGLMSMNMTTWDNAAALRAYRTYAEQIRDLAGMLPFQYAPYTAGRGRVLWVRSRAGDEIPVISPRFAIWNNSSWEQDGGPSEIAERLGAQPHTGAPVTTDHYSWVMVHAWSWFHHRQAGEPASAEEIPQSRGGEPGTARGVSPVRWCAERLAPHVRLVTPTQLVWTMRLRMHPRETLTRGLAQVRQEAQAGGRRSSAVQAKLREADALLARGDHRGAFAAGQEAHRLL